MRLQLLPALDQQNRAFLFKGQAACATTVWDILSVALADISDYPALAEGDMLATLR